LCAVEMDRHFWMVCVTHMFVEVYFLVQVALIPVFIREFQLSLFEASFVATVPSFIQLITNIPTGYLADRIGTNHILFMSMIAEGVSALAISQTNNFWMLVLGVSVMRASSPLYHITGLSHITQIVKQEKIARSMGFHNALGSFGSAIGLISLALFLSTTGWRWIYILWSVPIVIWGFVLLKSSQLKISRTARDEKGMTLNRSPIVFSFEFLIFLVAIGLREVGNTGTATFMTTYLVEIRELSEAAASLIFGLGPLMGIVGSLGGGYLGEKVGAKKALDIAMLGCIVSLSVLAASAQFHFLTFVYLVYAFFSNSVWSPMNTIVADLTPVTERGLSFSVYFFSEGLVVSITPAIAAAIIGLSDVWHIFPFSIIFLTTGLITLRPVSSQERTKRESHRLGYERNTFTQ